MTCLILEDEPLARSLMEDYVQKIPSLTLVASCASPLEALTLLNNQSVDLLFLDIQMPELTGISLLKTLQKKPYVIFTTAYSQFALEGYELDVVDYLLKPITFERFLKAVNKVNERIGSRTNEPSLSPPPAINEPSFVFVKDGTKLVKVFLDDILFVEGLKDYVTIYTKDKKIVTLQRLKALEDQLPANKFVRVHHSYIIALAAIEVIHKTEIQIGAHIVPISDSYRKNFKELIEKRQM